MSATRFATTIPKRASVSRSFACTNQVAAIVDALLVAGDSEQGLPKPLFFRFLNTTETHTRALSGAAFPTQNHPTR
jgi:hypothetical protein